MLIKVKVFPESKKEKIIKKSEDSFSLFVKEKPRQNQANFRVFKLLSNYFQIPQNYIRIVKGAKKSNKIFEIKEVINGKRKQHFM